MFTFSTDSPVYKYYPYFKWSVYSLLALNIILFFVHQTFFEGLESLAWVFLLMLFEYETSQMDKPYIAPIEKYGIHAGRFIAYILILYSGYEYTGAEFIAESGRLDMYNVITWLLVVALIEYDVYAPGYYSRIEWLARNITKSILYLLLILYAVLWGYNGELLDFYDAVLWIVCFFCIELNIFKFEESIPYEEEMLSPETMSDK